MPSRPAAAAGVAVVKRQGSTRMRKTCDLWNNSYSPFLFLCPYTFPFHLHTRVMRALCPVTGIYWKMVWGVWGMCCQKHLSNGHIQFAITIIKMLAKRFPHFWVDISISLEIGQVIHHKVQRDELGDLAECVGWIYITFVMQWFCYTFCIYICIYNKNI